MDEEREERDRNTMEIDKQEGKEAEQTHRASKKSKTRKRTRK